MAKDTHVLHCKLGPLKRFVPCSCHENPYRPPTYWVRTHTSTSYMVGKGPVIKEVRIQCDECGRTFFENIESYEIYESELDF